MGQLNFKLLKRLQLLLLAVIIPQLASAYDFMVNGLCYNKNSDGSSVTVTYQNSSNPRYTDLSGDLIIPESVINNGVTYSVTAIANSAFNGCTGLTSVTIPNSVTTIGTLAFYGCNGLTSLTIGNSFKSTPISLANVFSGCINLETITIESGNSYYDSRDNCNAIIQSATNTLVLGCKNSTIPNSVTAIGNNAFSGHKDLTTITIPYSVTSIGSQAFYNCSSLSSISLPNTVATLGRYAFNGTAWYNNQPLGLVYVGSFAYNYKGNMSNGTSIEIAEGTSHIADGCFDQCSNLSSVSIPNSVTSIGSQAFYNCNNLTSITIPNSITSIGSQAFDGTAWYKSQPNGLVYAGLFAYNYKGTMPNGTRIEIVDGTKGIANTCFSGCSGLSSLLIPESVTTIGIYAFLSCTGLTNIDCYIEVPSNVLMGSNVFNSVPTSTCTLNVPAGTIDLYRNTDQWRNFTNIVEMAPPTILATSVALNQTEAELTEGETLTLTATVLPDDATDKTVTWTSSDESIATVDQNGLVTAVTVGTATVTVTTTDGSDLCASCLLTVDQPEHIEFADAAVEQICLTNWDANNDGYLTESEAAAVTDLGDVFRLNETITSFEELQYFTGLTSIGDRSFYDCNSLTSIIIPNSVSVIGEYAFNGCSSLTSLAIGSSVTSIGNYAFQGCGMTSATIPASVISIGTGAFRGCESLTSIDIPNSVTSIGNGAFNYCENLTSVTLPNSLTFISDRLFARCTNLTNVTIPNSITSIGEEAFSYCFGLSTITLPNSIISISNDAFWACHSLTSIDIPSSVTSVGTGVFSQCNNLTEITVDSDNQNYDSRNNSNTIIETATNTLIAGCDNSIIPNSVTSIGESAFLGCSGLTSVEIPNTIISIGKNAYSYCGSLSSFTIPNSVSIIGDFAFWSCSGLTDIYCDNLNPADINLGSSVFNNVPTSTCTLHVPYGTSELYRNADQWSAFTNIVEMAPPTILATSVALDQTEAELAEGETLTLTATVLPEDATDKTVTWNSSDESVATVENGLVTAVSAGTATITATTADGSDLSASCEITVTAAAVISSNSLAVDNQSIIRGHTLTLPVQMLNTDDISALQTDIYLPAGFSFAVKSNGKYAVSLNGERNEGYHTISSNLQPDGALRVLISSMDSEVLLGNEGVLFTVDITTDDAMEAGDYTISFRNSVMSTDAAQEILAPDVNASVNVIALAPGDANGDTKVNVTDFVTTANYILDNTWTPFYFDVADLDQNGSVNVADLVGVANLILGVSTTQTAAPLQLKSFSGNGRRLYIDDFDIEGGETKEIQIMFENETEFSALQADLYMPDGLSIEKKTNGKYKFSLNPDRIEDHTVSSNPQEDGCVRILIASINSEPIYGNNGYIVSFKVTAEEDFSGSCMIELKNVIASTTGAVEYMLSDQTCYVNSIKGTLAEFLSENGAESGSIVSVKEPLTFVYVADDGKTVYAKDDNGFAMKDQWPYQPTATQVAGHKVFDKPEEFDQSNWVVLNLKEEITTSQLESLIGSKIKITGILRDRLNPEIDVDDMNVISEGQAYTPNLYTISSFGEGNDYFAMPPKPQEYVKIHWAIYQDGNFYMPKSENGINTEQLHGAVKPVLDMYKGGAFENGNMYELTGIVKALKPRVAAGGNTVYGVNVQDSEVSTYYELHPITSSKTDTDPVTSINRIGNDNEDNTYYNLLGQPVTNPAPGIYIKNGKRIIVR